VTHLAKKGREFLAEKDHVGAVKDGAGSRQKQGTGRQFMFSKTIGSGALDRGHEAKKP